MSASDDLIGRVLADRYRIDELIATGGMARVYRARDQRLERDVAVKVLSEPYADDPAFVDRFLHEARAAGSLSHPSLVHVYDSGTDGDAHYIVMELLVGHRTLRQELDEHGPLARDDVLRLAEELLAGLRVVHEHGLVHCDVKAGNIMLGDGPAKLIDFGIATPPRAATEDDTTVGSLAYMSPEQLHGESLGPASDLFSLGAVLYEALTGRVPFPGRTAEEVAEAQRAAQVRPPSTIAEGIPGRLDEAILQSLRREPDARFRSADAMSVAIATAEDAIEAGRQEETRVIHTAPSSAAGDASLPRAELRRPRTPAVPHRRRPAAPWSLLGSLVILGAAAAVVIFVVVPLVELGRGEGGGAGSSAAASVTPSATQVTTVVVPDLVGMKTKDAIKAAREAGLNWTVYCNEDRSQPDGIIDQQPPAGTEVARGAKFSLYSARIKDCRGR